LREKKCAGWSWLIFLPLFLACLHLAAADTLFMRETNSAGAMAWTDATTWTFAGGAAAHVPGPGDDVVFRDTACVQWGDSWVLLTTKATVHSVLIQANRAVDVNGNAVGQCEASLVVQGPGGALTAASFTATTGAQVLLVSGGQLSCPVLLFDTGALLGGGGQVSGEVQLRGNAVAVTGGEQWPAVCRFALSDTCMQ
jgi:hypothetical protein